MLVTAMFAVIYILTPEMFPTEIRGQCLALPDGISRIAAVVTPSFGILYQNSESLFWWMHVIMIAIGLVVTLFMPETSQVYPDTKSQCKDQKLMIQQFLEK